MIPFTAFRPETGEIVNSGWVDQLSDFAVQENNADGTVVVIEGDYRRERHYVVGQDVLDRPVLFAEAQASIPADGTTLVSFAVPPGTLVEFRGAQSTIDDGSFEFATTHPGRYVFIFDPPFPHRHQELEVTAHAL